MTDSNVPLQVPARQSWGLVVAVIVLAGALLALAYAWNQARQAATQAELALATATARLVDAETSRSTAEAGQNAAVATAQAELVGARATATAIQATVMAVEATAQARQAEALAAAAGETDSQARMAEANRLAAAALANLPANPDDSLVLATQAVSVSLTFSGMVPPEIVAALRQAIQANRLESLITAGHTGPVNDVAFSPDGNRLATVGDDGTVRIWDAAAGGELLALPSSPEGKNGHAGPIYSVAFSPTGDRLVTASFDKTARIWDAKTGRELVVLTGHKDWVVGAAFSPATAGDSRVATGSQDGTAIIWDATTGKSLLTLPSSAKGAGGHTAAVNRLAFNPVGDRLATTSDDGTVILWDTASGEPLLTLTGHTGPVYGVTFNPSGDRLATASVDGTVKIWETRSGREVRSLRHSQAGWATSVAYNATGTWLASAGEDGRVVIWDAETGRERLNLAGHTGAVNGLAISPRGDRLATASADGLVRVWQINGDEAAPAMPPLAGHRGPVYGVAVSPSGSRLATAGNDGTVKIWQVDSGPGRLVRTLAPAAGGALYTVVFSPGGKTLAAAGEDGTVTIWETTSSAFSEGEAGGQLSLAGHTAPIYALAFNSAGDRLASAGEDGTTRLWNTTTGESLAVLAPAAETTGGTTGPIYSLAFNPDGTRLATAAKDGIVNIWEVASGKQIAFLPGTGVPARALAFGPVLPTGDLLAVGGDDGIVRLWTVDQAPRALPGASAAIQALAFSPDNNRLAATAADGTVTIWSLVSGRVLQRLASPPGSLAGYGLAFLPGGTSLVAGSQGTTAETTATLLKWDVAADELLNLYSPAPAGSLALAGSAGKLDDQRLAVAGPDGVARLWQIEAGSGQWLAAPWGDTGKLTGVFPAGEKAVLTSVAVGEDYLAAGGDAGSVWVWEARSGELLATLAAHTGPVNSLVLAASSTESGGRLVTAGQDDTVKVWAISPAGTVDNRPQLTLRGHTGDVVAMSLNPAGLLATASHDGTARLWDLQESGREVLTLTGHSGWLHDVAFDAAGKRLATAGEDGTLRVWDAVSGRELLRLVSPEGPGGPINRVAFGPSGSGQGERLAALAGNGAVLVWTLAPGQDDATSSARLLFRLAPSQVRLDSLALDPTGRALVTAGDDGVVRFYALEVEDLLGLR